VLPSFDAGVIARTYLHGSFAFDFVSAMPWDTLGAAVVTTRAGLGHQVMGIKLLRLPRLLRLSRLVRQLQTLTSSTAFRVLLLLLVYLVVAHWAACLFHYLSKWQMWNASAGWADASSDVLPWLVVQCLQFSGCVTRYCAALYWACSTMATVGFGDVTGITNMERCFAVFVELVAGVLQGVVFGNMAMALRGIEGSQQAVRRHMTDLADLAKVSALPSSLASRLRSSSRRMLKRRHDADTAAVTDSLSGALRGEVIASMEGSGTVMRASLFKDMPPAFVRALLFRLKVHAVLPGEVVASQGDPAHELYVIHKGAVNMELSLGETVCLSQGDMFCEADAVLCRRQSARYVAIEDATLFSLCRHDLDSVLAEFPELIGALTANCMARETALRRASSYANARALAAGLAHGLPEGSFSDLDSVSLHHVTQQVAARVNSRRLSPVGSVTSADSGAAATGPQRKVPTAVRGSASSTEPTQRHIPLTPRFVDRTPRMPARSLVSASPESGGGSALLASNMRHRLARAVDAQASALASIDARLRLLQEKQVRAIQEANAALGGGAASSA